jgi:hypothetical protein
VIANAEHCQRALRANGADASLIDVGAVDHTTSLVLALPRLLDWFQQRR